MKKIVRLTESDLVRLVKKVIKENEFDMDMGIDCDRIIDEMEYVYNDTMRYYKRSSSDTKSILGTSDVYNDLMEELSGLLDMADQNDCENFREVESMYYELLDMFVEETGMDNDMDNMTESIRRKSKKSSRR
jgi:alpha-L-fucosidase